MGFFHKLVAEDAGISAFGMQRKEARDDVGYYSVTRAEISQFGDIARMH